MVTELPLPSRNPKSRNPAYNFKLLDDEKEEIYQMWINERD